jgi:transposase
LHEITQIAIDACISRMTNCPRCETLREALEKASGRNGELERLVAQLEAARAELEAQLGEMTKLCDLQQADLDRYKKAYEASRPNHPERAPREQLQLAFERVLETFQIQAPANDPAEADDGTVAAPGGDVTAGSGHTTKTKKRHRHGRRNLELMNLPVVEQRVAPEEVTAAGGVGFELIDEEVSYRIARRLAQWVRLRTVRLKYARRAATGSGQGLKGGGDTDSSPDDAARDGSQSDETCEPDTRILMAPLPANLWPNVMADASAIAHIIISKYDDLLPLTRQQNISARDGFMGPKSTQCGWLKEADALCVRVVDAMFDDSRKQAFIMATDATSAPVLPPRLEAQAKAEARRLWPVERRECESWHIYVFIADRDHVVFRYDREHNGQVFEKLLEGYHGHLLADAASVFDVLYRDHGMTEHGCWFHCRRPFYRALETDQQRALEALSLIGKLFEVERELRAQKLDLATFTALRAERTRPILNWLDQWVELHRGRVDPRSPLEAAITYYTNQRDALHRFVEDGRIRLDNNESEGALRKLVVGLSNWVFFANETGIRWYTTFRSLIASCMLHRLNPEIYLEQLLRIVPHWPKNRVLELAPKYWTRTVAGLDAQWRAILERPWEPGVVASAELESDTSSRTPVEQAA